VENNHTVGYIETSRKKVPVYVEGRSFASDVEGQVVYGSSFDELEKRVRVEVAKRKLTHNIQVVVWYTKSGKWSDHGKYERATLRGRHGRTSEYLWTLTDGEKLVGDLKIVALGEQMKDSDIEELNRLHVAAVKAREDEEKYLKKFSRDAQSAWTLIDAAE